MIWQHVSDNERRATIDGCRVVARYSGRRRKTGQLHKLPAFARIMVMTPDGRLLDEQGVWIPATLDARAKRMIDQAKPFQRPGRAGRAQRVVKPDDFSGDWML